VLEYWRVEGPERWSVGVLECWRTGGIRAVAGDKSQESGIQDVSARLELDGSFKQRHLI